MVSVDRMTPAERKKQDEIMSVALANPDRRGNSDPRAGEPLWEACQRLRLREELYHAGCDYGTVSRAAKLAMACAAVQVRAGLGDGSIPDDDQQAARDRLSRQRYDDAVRALRRTSPHCHQVLEEYCFDQRHVGHWGDCHLTKGLEALANLWGMIDRGINEGKPI